MQNKLIVWFSCGAASAVTAKICLSKYAKTHKVIIAQCVIENEHKDNERFARECEQWYGQEIIRLKSDKYASTWDVWESKKYLKSIHGAPCTTEMKRKVRFTFQEQVNPNIQAFGYTVEEQDRKEIFNIYNPDVNLITPLIDEGLSKSDCLAIIEDAGIEIPMMYRLGFSNNNCIGCVKGGMGYWNHIRKVFPDIFERMAGLERKLNHALIRRYGFPLFLDELDPDAGKHNEPEIDCSLFCQRAEMYYDMKNKGLLEEQVEL